MDHTEKIDQDAVLRARTLLLGSGGLSIGRQVEAYRVLSEVSPLAYLPKLAEALLSYGYSPEVRDRPEVRLALHAESAAAARRIDAGWPNRAELLVRALSAFRYELYSAGRREEGLAISEEMAEAGQWGFAHGQVSGAAYGHSPLAVALAEEGRHEESAELCGKLVRSARGESPANVSFWTLLTWAAELDAAGLHDAALEAFAEIVRTSHTEADEKNSATAILIWQLVHQAGMLDAGGHRVEAREARQNALALLSELDRGGNRKSGSAILSWWTTLYALSGRPAEPRAFTGTPAPAFGFPFLQWSPDIKQAYFDGVPALEEEAAGLREAAASDPPGHLADLVALHRRLTIRSTVRCVERGHSALDPLRPLFDEGVALARRSAVVTGAAPSREALGRALTDRSMFLVAAKQHGEACDDLREVVDLLG